MLLPLETLDQRELVRVLAEQYGVEPAPIEFVPLGADSWNYRMADLWVSVRRDLRGHLPAAYEAAAGLHRAGMEFALAPIAGHDGRISCLVGDNPVLVFPFLQITALDDDDDVSEADLDAAAGMIAALHAAAVDTDLPAETYELPFDDDLTWTVEVAHSAAPDTGPYSAPLHDLIRTNAVYIAELREEFAELAVKCAAASEPFVLTHGEPGAGNVLRHGNSLLLGDWGELMYGPPERDWYHLSRSFGMRSVGRGEFLRFYEIRWIFNELTEYAVRLFGPHADDVDDREAWRQVRRCLPATC